MFGLAVWLGLVGAADVCKFVQCAVCSVEIAFNASVLGSGYVVRGRGGVDGLNFYFLIVLAALIFFYAFVDTVALWNAAYTVSCDNRLFDWCSIA